MKTISPEQCHHWEGGRVNTKTLPSEVSEIFADTTRDSDKKNESGKHKKKKKLKDQSYNTPFTDRELKSHKTAPEDTIHSQMIKWLPTDTEVPARHV